MKLKEIVLAGALLLSSSAALSQNKLKFDVYSREEGLLKLLNSSSLRINSEQIDFSFLFDIYSMEFQKLTDSTYREIVRNNFLWQAKDEFFDYSKDSCYTLLSYSAVRGKPREEKKALVERRFDKKYLSLPELFKDFEEGRLENGDSLHFIVNGMPYSVKIKRRENQDSIIYSSSLEDIIKREPGDIIICPYPIEVYAIEKDGKFVPIGFSTELLRVKNGKKIPINGKLREEKD